tara:strand:+ start:543 stop:674 length:132 start_codon:yes stop_codon:yes gene_type:complete
MKLSRMTTVMIAAITRRNVLMAAERLKYHNTVAIKKAIRPPYL